MIGLISTTSKEIRLSKHLVYVPHFQQRSSVADLSRATGYSYRTITTPTMGFRISKTSKLAMSRTTKHPRPPLCERLACDRVKAPVQTDVLI